MTYFSIEKEVFQTESEDGSTSTSFYPLPPEVLAAAGGNVVDLGSFVVAYVANVEKLLEPLNLSGLVYTMDPGRTIQFPHHSFDPLDDSQRTVPGFTRTFMRAVPGLFVVQFAYPPTDAVYDAFKDCGIDVVATFQSESVLVKAIDLGAITSCSNAESMLWIDNYLTTDRLSPEMLTTESPLGYSFQFKPSTDLLVKEGALPNSAVIDEAFADPESNTGFIGGTLSLADLITFAANDADLLSVTWRGEATFSDERQGQIVAGNYTSLGTVVAPGYKAWLECPPKPAGTPCKSLAMAQQLVAMFDSGYDSGLAVGTQTGHHPDLIAPDRLEERKNFSGNSGVADSYGHGTMVAGIIAGAGNTLYPPYQIDPVSFLTGGHKDPQGFFLGTGIAPGTRLLLARMADSSLSDTRPATPTTNPPFLGGQHELALQWARNRTDNDRSDRALIVNESWNQTIPFVTGGVVTDALPLNTYDQKAQFYDGRVRDANVVKADWQPMTVVFSAGNQGSDRFCHTTRYVTRLGAVCTGAGIPGSIGSPGTAKNVITVGASANYRPGEDPPSGCRDDATKGRFVGDDAPHVSAIGSFSGRGGLFGLAPKAPVHQVRVKPDLVAPAIRVFTTVPFYPYIYSTGPGCVQYYPPNNADHYYAYGSGTSFAAPVVSGVAALTRQWFLDQVPSLTPSPSMLKAAMVATADTLGGQMGNNHRPSPDYGWGRVNLGKIVDGRVARFFVESPQPFTNVATAPKTVVWERTIDSASRDTYIVLAWIDPPAEVTGGQGALLNDLELRVEEVGTSPLRYWVGNNFNENVGTSDNGYSFRFGAGIQPVQDKVNNVEAVFIPANVFAAGQKLRIVVSAKSLVSGARQLYSVYAYNVRRNS
ncbi:MAG TPA: S8 family serine peptidase [Thermoanaerobaculia bacterium]|nr:S8 family serine peptidase [Thermoanaerobaculia bacterium]